MTEPHPTSSRAARAAEQIVEATARCIARDGIENASITAIANEANVSRALVSHYYPVKSEIFRSVVLFISAKARNFIHDYPSELGGIERVRLVMFRNLEFFLNHSVYFKCFYLFYFYAAIDPTYRDLNTELTKNTVGRFEAFIQDCLPKDKPLTEVQRTEISEFAELLHREIVAGIQKFYIVNHSIPVELYKLSVFAAIEKLVLRFISQWSDGQR